MTTELEPGTLVAARVNVWAGPQIRVPAGRVGRVAVSTPDYRGKVGVRFQGHRIATWCRPQDLEAL